MKARKATGLALLAATFISTSAAAYFCVVIPAPVLAADGSGPIPDPPPQNPSGPQYFDGSGPIPDPPQQPQNPNNALHFDGSDGSGPIPDPPHKPNFDGRGPTPTPPQNALVL